MEEALSTHLLAGIKMRRGQDPMSFPCTLFHSWSVLFQIGPAFIHGLETQELAMMRGTLRTGHQVSA